MVCRESQCAIGVSAGNMIGYIETNASGTPMPYAKQGLTGTWATGVQSTRRCSPAESWTPPPRTRQRAFAEAGVPVRGPPTAEPHRPDTPCTSACRGRGFGFSLPSFEGLAARPVDFGNADQERGNRNERKGWRLYPCTLILRMAARRGPAACAYGANRPSDTARR